MDFAPEDWERVKQLFEAALELEPCQRPAFLARNCPDEGSRKQIEELLLNYQQAGSFLDEPVLDFKIATPDRSKSKIEHHSLPEALGAIRLRDNSCKMNRDRRAMKT